MSPKNLLFAAVAAAAVLLAVSCLAGGQFWLALGVLGVGLAWLVLEVFEKLAVPGVFFAALVGAAALAGLNGVPALLLLAGLLAALAAWDLSRFLCRVRRASAAGASPALVQRHLRQLSLTLGIGLIAAILPLLFTVSLTFAALVALALTALFVLQKAILSLRKG